MSAPQVAMAAILFGGGLLPLAVQMAGLSRRSPRAFALWWGSDLATRAIYATILWWGGFFTWTR